MCVSIIVFVLVLDHLSDRCASGAKTGLTPSLLSLFHNRIKDTPDYPSLHTPRARQTHRTSSGTPTHGETERSITVVSGEPRQVDALRPFLHVEPGGSYKAERKVGQTNEAPHTTLVTLLEPP